MRELSANPRFLHEWMNIATRDLCDKAKGRLYAEYEAHHADAVASALASGASRAEAEAAALAGLGDPKKARRALNRIHLTREDMIFLQARIKPPKAFNGVRETLIAFVRFAMLMAFAWYMLSWQLVLICSVIIALNRNLAALHPKWLSLRTALAITSLLDFIPGAIMLNMLWQLFKGQFFWAWAVILCCGGAADLWRSCRIFYKLGRHPAVADDFEPPRTLSA